MKMQFVLGVVCASLVSVLAAQAEEGAKDPAKKADRPKGGYFESVDTDKSGDISLEEFKASHEKRAAAHKAKMGDKAKPMPAAEDVFAKLDADKDGKLTKDEMAKSRGGAKKPEQPKDQPAK